MEEIGRLLPAVFKRNMRRTDPLWVEILAPLWPRVAGKPLAQRCRPVAFEGGTLTLAANCSSWAAELRRLAEEIRARINSFLGEPLVKKLRVRYEPSRSPSEAVNTLGKRNSKPGIRNSKIGTRLDHEFRVSNFEFRSEDGDARLDPETARLVERSFTKYFARGSRGVR